MIAASFLSKIGEGSTGRWFQTREDWDETRIHQPFLFHAAFFHVRIRVRRDERLSEPKRKGRAAHKKPLAARIKRYPIWLGTAFIFHLIIDPLLTKAPRQVMYLFVKCMMLGGHSRF